LKILYEKKTTLSDVKSSIL